jgi:nucleoside-diphosphate-sugar epimerase
MQKALVTGATGFLGREITDHLRSAGFEVKTLGRSKCDYNFSLEKGEPSFNQKFDLVVHVAGKAHIVPKTKEEADDFFAVNVTGTENLLKELDSSDIKEFVFISSVSAYGLKQGLLINEDNPLLASDPYGKSKILAETIIHEWCMKRNIIYTALRLPLLVGKNPPGNLGSMIKSIKKGLFFTIGGGNASKSMVLTRDVARVIPLISNIGGVYNVTDGYNPTFRELSDAFEKNYNKKVYNLPLLPFKILASIGDKFAFIPFNSQVLNKIILNFTFDDSKLKKAVVNWKPIPVLDYLKTNVL